MAPSGQLPASQGPGGSSGSVSRQLIDIGAMQIGPSQAANETLIGSEIFRNFHPNTAPPPRATVAPPAKKSRRTVRYSNRYLLANSSMFLHPTYRGMFTDQIVEVVGQIKQCARASNGFEYRVDWRRNKGNPLPTGLDPSWLREYFPKDFEPKLQAGFERFEEVYPTNEFSVSVNVDGQAVAVSQQAPSVGTPPAIIRGRAGSALRTAGTTGSRSLASTISSLTNSNRSRRSRTSESDPFDNGLPSDVEDGSELDETDDNPILLDGYDSSSDDEDDDNNDDDDKDNEEDADTPQDPECTVAELIAKLIWKFENVPEGQALSDPAQPEPYNGPTGLKPGVARSFNDPLECLAKCGGLDRQFISRLARNSNEYARKELMSSSLNGRVHGRPFKMISTAEMHVFLGITLKISLSPVDGGGYESYFRRTNKVIHGVEIENSCGFAQKYMTLWRYKQIRSAFHPEPKHVGFQSGDKAYQMRAAINQLNAAAALTFFIGACLTFDEGGCGSRSRRCPIRQYNSNKPDKFRIDFFILSCATLYCIHHIDVYQGKNAPNVGIDDSIHGTKTTQKYVYNAIISCKINENEYGAPHLALDNRYQCPELAYTLRERYNVLSTGTTRKGRVGWDNTLMNLLKSAPKGSSKFAYDKVNRILCAQWNDSKVVNCVTTVIDNSMDEVQRQKGRDLLSFPCPSVIRLYQKTMFGVDKGDQIRAHGGGFAKKAHYKKWYKKGFFAILDCMLLNAWIAWKESLKDRSVRGRPVLERHEFYTYCAEKLLSYSETTEDMPVGPSDPTMPATVDGVGDATTHIPVPSKTRQRCIVCKLEMGIDRSIGEEGLSSGVCRCQDESCQIYCHNTVQVGSNRKIHSLTEFKNRTCFSIAHHPDCQGLWNINPQGKHKTRPNYSHAIYQQLRTMHGKDPKLSRKRKRTTEDTASLVSDTNNNH